MNSTDRLLIPEIDESETGLPGLRRWPMVYLMVLGSFVIWVGLLIAIERFFS